MQVCTMNNLINTDRGVRSKNNDEPAISSRYDIKRAPDDRDQGPVLVVIALLVFFAVLIGFFASAVKAADADSSPVSPAAEQAPATATEKSVSPAESVSPADWRPPAMPKPMPFSSQKLDPEVVKALKERWGVELLGIRQSGAGMFLDFRFKVLDAEKSLPLFDHRIKPYLVAEKSDIKLPIPQAAKVGSFRPTNRGKNIKADKIYYMLFGNPDRHVKPGEKVSVIIGEFKVEHLTVQ